MNRLAPSILSADFARLGEEARLVEAAGAQILHVDVMDGHFVPNITIGPVVVRSLVGKTNLPFDVHLMIEGPERFLADFVTEQTEFITVHAEACIHLHRTIERIKSFGVKAGVSINPGTPISALDAVFDDLDQVLVMSVNPGFAGQAFIPSALDKLAALKEKKMSRNPNLTLAVDGGINLSNIGQVVEAGANLVVAGSAIFGASDVTARVKELIQHM